MPQWPILKNRKKPSADVETKEFGDRETERELVIGNSLRFRGDLEVAAHLRIEGAVKGCISAGDFDIVIEEGGLAEANVHAGSVTVRGKVRGAILASGTVTLAATATVEGPIHAARVVLEEGCHLAGRIDVSSGIQTAPAPTQPVIAGRGVDMDRVRQINESLRANHDC